MNTRERIYALTSTEKGISGSEEANAANAAEFMASALADLRDGDYAGFLCNMDLAGQFARDARMDYYARQPR
jgi:hypothetical protein